VAGVGRIGGASPFAAIQQPGGNAAFLARDVALRQAAHNALARREALAQAAGIPLGCADIDAAKMGTAINDISVELGCDNGV
jgi:hypothetical protein